MHPHKRLSVFFGIVPQEPNVSVVGVGHQRSSSPPRIWKVLFWDFPGLRPEALDLRLAEVAPFLLQALDQAEVNRVLDRLAVAQVAHLFVRLLGREPIPARERLPAAQDLLAVDVGFVTWMIEAGGSRTPERAQASRK